MEIPEYCQKSCAEYFIPPKQPDLEASKNCEVKKDDIVSHVLIFGLKLVLLAMFLLGWWYLRKQWVLREAKRIEKKNEHVQKIVKLVQQGQTHVV